VVSSHIFVMSVIRHLDNASFLKHINAYIVVIALILVMSVIRHLV